MSQRTWPQTQAPPTLNRKTRMLNFRFFPAGVADPVLSGPETKGVASVAHTSTGLFTITLQDSYKRLLSAQATIQMASATDLVPQFGAISNLGTTSPVTLVLRTNTGATPTDIAANASNSISVTLIFDDADT